MTDESTPSVVLTAIEALRKPEDVECPPWPACERHGGFGSRGCTCGQEYRNEQSFTYNEALDDAIAVLTPVVTDAGQREAQERAEALREAASEIDGDEDLALNIVLGGPGYVTYWLRARADRSPEQT